MRRYALYHAPEPGPLADFAAGWLGWDAARGVSVAHPDLPLPMAEITKTPRKYGFHATLKPPFRLAGHPDDLDKALRALAGGLAPVSLQGLELARLSDFLALRPIGPTKGLNALAARLVRDLDHLRAPLTPTEYARRRPESLSPRQRGYLESWGYPYVLDEFRFHMTLTGPLTGPQLDRTEAILRPALAPMLSGPCVIRDICLFGEAEDGFFHLMKRYPLGRAAPSCCGSGSC